MSAVTNPARRRFLGQSAGLVVAFHIPFTAQAQAAQSPEVNAWVVVKPDDTIVIRIARSEMGQGTLTGQRSWWPKSSMPTGPR